MKEYSATSLVCPECGSDDVITNGSSETVSDRLHDGLQMRRRRKKCRVCGELFTTYELYAKHYIKIRNDSKMMKAIQNYLEKQEGA